MILYINACVRAQSRTDLLARELLDALGDEYEEVKLEDLKLQPLYNETLEKRSKLVDAGDFSDPMFYLAKQFAKADVIVIGAPYWDMSFPSILKIYLENIFVVGIVTKYNEEGIPEGMCNGKRMFYVTTAGGEYVSDYSYAYCRDVFTKYFGFVDTNLIDASNLDIVGANVDEILETTKSTIRFRQNLFRIVNNGEFIL